MGPIKTVYTEGINEELKLPGRTEPIGAHCYCKDTDERADYVVKLRGHREVNDPLAAIFECVASRLAQLVGLKTPEPAVVVVTDELAMSSSNETIRLSIGLNFGSKYMEGLPSWMEPAAWREELLDQALAIFVFDALVDNPDRLPIPGRGNLLYDGEAIIVLDHEVAFGFTMAIGQPNKSFLREHIFYSEAKKKKDKIADIAVRMSEQLEPAIINEIIAGLPEPWRQDGADYLEKIKEYLLSIHREPQAFMRQIQEEIA